VSCAGFSVVPSQAALATTMTNVMVCDPFGGPVGHYHAQEWMNGAGQFLEASDPVRNPYGTYTLGSSGNGANVRGTITYHYTGGGNYGPYMVALNTSTTPNTLFFCNDSNGNNNPAVYTTAYIPRPSVTPCP
jgi:hypothetical protein